MRLSFYLCTTLLFLSGTVCAQTSSLGVRLPAGFTITEYAGSELANDIYTLTIDPKGRIIVAGRKYIRILVDDNNDGKADRALPFADTPKDGAMGMLWEGDTLYVTGDGGLRKFRDANGDGRADGPAQLIRRMRTGSEHAAHAIRRGPDGWLYVLCGNHTGIDRSFAQTATSPVKEPIAGCVVRFSPDLQMSEIVADGFRNAYGMDFNSDGELFAYDSDNERCVSLPWYEYTRFYHVIPGGFHGWLSPQRAQFWRCPPYFVDVVAPLTTLQRGSPTGVVCYRHMQFPKKYRGGMFACDWTFGKIYFVQLQRRGSTYSYKKEVFLEAIGDSGFAPTGIEVHPQTGDLYISIGGRGTRGAVYRVRYKGGLRKLDRTLLTALQPARRSLVWNKSLTKTLLKAARADDLLQRRRALHLLRRHAKRFSDTQLREVIRANWNEKDRYTRQATALLIRQLSAKSQQALAKHAKQPHAQITFALARSAIAPKDVLSEMLRLVEQTPDSARRLEAIRLVQIALGDVSARSNKNHVWEGYSTRGLPKSLNNDAVRNISERLIAVFPTKATDVDREIARTLAMIQCASPTALQKITAKLQTTTDPIDQIHYLIVLSRLSAQRNSKTTATIADALIGLDYALDKRNANRDRHWPMRIREMYSALAKHDQQLHKALLTHKQIGRPAHALYARTAGFPTKQAASVYLRKVQTQADYPWTAQVVQLIGMLPAQQALPELRNQWDTSGLQMVILPVLARSPHSQDRSKFVDGLKSPNVNTIRTCVNALTKLPARNDAQEILALIAAQKRLPKGKVTDVRKAIGSLLHKWTGKTYATDHQAWTRWFTKTHPRLAKQLTNPDGVDVGKWQQRLTKVDWSVGDSKRGHLVFKKANCLACHSGGQALGPDLRGVANRFSRDDLFTAMIQPSRDVSSRYQTTMIETDAGKIYQGLVIYQAVDGVIVQTGATETIRIPGKQIVTQQRTTTSLMPTGLLDRLSERELADLYAYLRSLKK